MSAGEMLGRDAFLTAISGGAVALAGGAWLAAGAGAAVERSASEDRSILNFALLLEFVKTSFYEDALKHGGLGGELRRFAQVAAAHEREHVQALKQALGAHARPEPRVRFGAETRDPHRFRSTAIVLEDLAVAAYNGQAANLTTAALATAIKIVSVEGRHSAWIRAIADEEPAPTAADPGEDVAAVTATLRRMHIG